MSTCGSTPRATPSRTGARPSRSCRRTSAAPGGATTFTVSRARPSSAARRSSSTAPARRSSSRSPSGRARRPGAGSLRRASSPASGDDGAVSFLDKTNNHVTSLVIDPVQILDRSGKEITPEGLRWDLEKTDSGWWLTLDLDDSELPLPYVIDPAVTYRAPSATSNIDGGATSLVAHHARRRRAERTSSSRSSPSAGHRRRSPRRPAGRSCATPTTGRRCGSRPSTRSPPPPSPPATPSTFSARASGRSAASPLFYGVRTSRPARRRTASRARATPARLRRRTRSRRRRPTRVALAFYAARRDSAFSQAGRLDGALRHAAGERHGGQPLDVGADYEAHAHGRRDEQRGLDGQQRPAGSPTQAAFLVDNVNPTGSVTDPGSPLAGTSPQRRRRATSTRTWRASSSSAPPPTRTRGRTSAPPTRPPPTRPPSTRPASPTASTTSASS